MTSRSPVCSLTVASFCSTSGLFVTLPHKRHLLFCASVFSDSWCWLLNCLSILQLSVLQRSILEFSYSCITKGLFNKAHGAHGEFCFLKRIRSRGIPGDAWFLACSFRTGLWVDMSSCEQGTILHNRLYWFHVYAITQSPTTIIHENCGAGNEVISFTNDDMITNLTSLVAFNETRRLGRSRQFSWRSRQHLCVEDLHVL